MRPLALLAGLSVTGAILLAVRYLKAAPSPLPAPANKPPSPSPKATSTKNPMNPTPQPSSLRYQTLIGNTKEKYGRVALKSGKGFTLAPLWDTFNDTWARADYQSAEKILASHGLRMPTFDELDEVASRPDVTITKLCNQPPTAQMATKAWWDKFDLCIQGELDRLGWSGSTPVLFGKAWALVVGAPTYTKLGQLASWLHGFYVPKGDAPGSGFSSIVQNRGKTAHDRGHVDYSQLLYGVEV